MLKSKQKINQIVIVEGKCDKNVVESVLDAVIIPVNGFGIYKDKAKLSMLRSLAKENGAILLTDSDNAGRQIRNFLKEALQGCEVMHLYVPNLYEVEDTSSEIIKSAFEKACHPKTDERLTFFFTRQNLFDDGLIGSANSAKLRRELLKRLNLPENLSVTAFLEVLNKCGEIQGEYKKWSSQV
jgi:ribonuclease M5